MYGLEIVCMDLVLFIEIVSTPSCLVYVLCVWPLETIPWLETKDCAVPSFHSWFSSSCPLKEACIGLLWKCDD